MRVKWRVLELGGAGLRCLQLPLVFPFFFLLGPRLVILPETCDSIKQRAPDRHASAGFSAPGPFFDFFSSAFNFYYFNSSVIEEHLSV